MRPGLLLVPVLGLCAGLASPGRASQGLDVRQELLGKADFLTTEGDIAAGVALSATEAARTEAQVQSRPDDTRSRATLLGYYYQPSLIMNEAAQAARAHHVLWFIENRPESRVLDFPQASLTREVNGATAYEEAKLAWLRQIDANPEGTLVIANAARFFEEENPTLTLSLLDKGRRLEPGDPSWPKRLGGVSLSMARNDPDAGRRYSRASSALRELETALGMASTLDLKLELDPELAEAAYLVGRDDKAARYAGAAVTKARVDRWNYSDLVHDGYTILGLVALRARDTKKAAECLVKSGDVRGSPRLDSLGPRMELAKALIEAGERDAVLDYLEMAGKFWKPGARDLARWTADIKGGMTPEFGNLRLIP